MFCAQPGPSFCLVQMFVLLGTAACPGVSKRLGREGSWLVEHGLGLLSRALHATHSPSAAHSSPDASSPAVAPALASPCRWRGAARAATASWARRWRSPPTAPARRRTPLTPRSRCVVALRCAVLCHAALCVSWMCSIRPAAGQLLRLSSSPHLSMPAHVHGCRLLPPLPMFQDIVDRAYRAQVPIQQIICFPC